MIIPITLNGSELFFLLDTGVEHTILFSLDEKEPLELQDLISIKISGLGEEESVHAFKSTNNHIAIGKAVSNDFSLYILLDHNINLSRFLGVPVHGIIGYDFFKNFIVEINYSREFIKFYDPLAYDKNQRNYETLPLFFHHNKPYVKARALVSGNSMPLTLLIDSGASDALWLFFEDETQIPEAYFEDFLGLGLSGLIYGKRSKIHSFSLGGFQFENIATAFPDSLTWGHFEQHFLKDGLIGSEVLKRFDLVFDYPHKRLLFRPNRFFDDPFYYDMSGLVVSYSGIKLVKELNYVKLNHTQRDRGVRIKDPIKKKYTVRFRLRPQLEIVSIRKGSPADIAGLTKGDIIVKVNGKEAYHFTLAELAQLFSSKVGKRIKIKIAREGKEFTKKFRLQKML